MELIFRCICSNRDGKRMVELRFTSAVRMVYMPANMVLILVVLFWMSVILHYFVIFVCIFFFCFLFLCVLSFLFLSSEIFYNFAFLTPLVRSTSIANDTSLSEMVFYINFAPAIKIGHRR